MSLRRCMREHTERELRVWMAWLDDQYDAPSRGDFYLMQIACEVRRVLASNPRGFGVSDFRLRFNAPAQRPRPRSRDEAAAWSKARWFAAVGLKSEPADSAKDYNRGN